MLARSFLALKRAYFKIMLPPESTTQASEDEKKPRSEFKLSRRRLDKTIHRARTARCQLRRAYRLQVVEEFLKAGILLRKIDKLRPLLEKQGYRLIPHFNMKEYIPRIYKQEIQRIKEEIR